MDSEKKNQKRPYDPPQIFEMDVDLTQAMGATQCGRGHKAVGGCYHGSAPRSPGCSAGPYATVQCTNGNRPGTSCSHGNFPAM